MAWKPTAPPAREAIATSKARIDAFLGAGAGWVVEGCYADLIELACAQFNREPPRIVETAATRLADTQLYAPYFGTGANLDDTRAREILGPLGIAVPPLRDYFATLIDYAERARWGKTEITRQAAAAHAPSAGA